MSDKIKYPYAEAFSVANEILNVLDLDCEPGYCQIAGSLRRKKGQVGDIEILFVPKIEAAVKTGEMFARPINLAAKTIEDMCAIKYIEPRQNRRDQQTWGDLIKLARHVKTGIPIDFFTATKENWFNYLVCRTGPAESNIAICKAAQKRGMKWEPYSSGFVNVNDPSDRIKVSSENAVFEFVGLKHLPPNER